MLIFWQLIVSYLLWYSYSSLCWKWCTDGKLQRKSRCEQARKILCQSSVSHQNRKGYVTKNKDSLDNLFKPGGLDYLISGGLFQPHDSVIVWLLVLRTVQQVDIHKKRKWQFECLYSLSVCQSKPWSIDQLFLQCVHTSSSLLEKSKSAPPSLRCAVEGEGRYFFTLASDLFVKKY